MGPHFQMAALSFPVSWKRAVQCATDVFAHFAWLKSLAASQLFSGLPSHLRLTPALRQLWCKVTYSINTELIEFCESGAEGWRKRKRSGWTKGTDKLWICYILIVGLRLRDNWRWCHSFWLYWWMPGDSSWWGFSPLPSVISFCSSLISPSALWLVNSVVPGCWNHDWWLPAWLLSSLVSTAGEHPSLCARVTVAHFSLSRWTACVSSFWYAFHSPTVPNILSKFEPRISFSFSAVNLLSNPPSPQ
jgi:hypothetical protein